MLSGHTSLRASFADSAWGLRSTRTARDECPHCASDAQTADRVDGIARRCRTCGFIFPRSSASSTEFTLPASPSAADTVIDTASALRLERYEIIRSLGAGAQGRLVLARDRHLDHLCVVKILKVLDESMLDVAVTRLKNEARAGVYVNHPNVARVFDCDCAEGLWYFVMEYVDGQNLRDIVQAAGRLSWGQAVDIGIQVASGLAAIHDAALIHRDIKPSNLMLRPDGMVKIMDLGLVKVPGAESDPGVTRVGQVLGTPNFMAPEQFDAASDLTPHADIYALGGALYFLLVGRPPFEGTGVLDVAQKHRRAPVTWPEEVARTVPPWLRYVVETCLAKRPDHRYASAGVLVEALRAGEDQSRLKQPHSERPAGVTVQTFRNLTARADDDWIGEAIAECLANRLAQVEGLHLADRNTFARMLTAAGSSATENKAVLEVARKLGAGSVVLGTVQRVGASLRITANLLSGELESTQHVGTVSGPLEDLFTLEDQLGDKLIELIGRTLSPRRRRASIGGTESLEAMEKLIRARRAFADAKYQQAIDLAHEALSIDPAYLEPISVIGACYARLGEYDRAVEHHQRQERLARELDDQPRLAEALSNIGVMYYYKGEYSLAYEFLDRSRQILQDLSLHGEAAKILGNLGFALMRLDRLEEAEAVFAESIAINKQFADLVSLQWPYNGMGTVLLKLERYAEASEYYRRALALAEEIGDRVNVGISQMNLGRCACLVGDFLQAADRFDAALATLQGTSFWNGLTLVYEYMAEMHLLTDRPEAALAAIDQRIDLACRHDNHRMEAEAWEQKARAFELLGQTDKALTALKRSVEISQRPSPHESLHVYLAEVCRRPAFG